jgi:16S rRNA (cytosine1402-N4)-methyltransferase
LAAGSVTLQKQKRKRDKTKMHEPVLLNEVLELLSPKSGESYLDMTAGYGGHANEILKKTYNFKGSVLVDRDQSAIDQLQAQFKDSDAKIIKADFYEAAKELDKKGRQFDLILADLGVSSPHLNTASRGFSFLKSGSLDMRMDQSQDLTAATILNKYTQDDLETIIREYGEEPKARIIAKSIVAARPLNTTTELANTIARTLGGWHKKHPATRTFQALRIAVNDELGLLTRALPLMYKLLAPGGRMGVISFHSLEDRIVKNFFAENSGDRYDANLKLLTKSPISPSNQEIVHNPRSRSSKLRVVEKIKIKERASDEN